MTDIDNGMFSTRDVAKACGLTFRQLDYWIREGAITPAVTTGEGPGYPRRWSTDDMETLMKISAVIHALERHQLSAGTLFVGRCWEDETYLTHIGYWIAQLGKNNNK